MSRRDLSPDTRRNVLAPIRFDFSTLNDGVRRGEGTDEGIWEGREDEWDRANERYDRCVALVQNGSLRFILGGDIIDKLVGMIFSSGRKFE